MYFTLVGIGILGTWFYANVKCKKSYNIRPWFSPVIFLVCMQKFLTTIFQDLQINLELYENRPPLFAFFFSPQPNVWKQKQNIIQPQKQQLGIEKLF